MEVSHHVKKSRGEPYAKEFSNNAHHMLGYMPSHDILQTFLSLDTLLSEVQRNTIGTGGGGGGGGGGMNRAPC